MAATLEQRKNQELPLSYPWLAPPQAALYLGRPVGWFQRRCNSGEWKLGTHYRLTNQVNAKVLRYQINVEQVAEWMSTPLNER